MPAPVRTAPARTAPAGPPTPTTRTAPAMPAARPPRAGDRTDDDRTHGDRTDRDRTDRGPTQGDGPQDGPPHGDRTSNERAADDRAHGGPARPAHDGRRGRGRIRGTGHPHDDAPDTADAFRRLSRMPEGAVKEELRQQIATAWLPMAHRLAGRYRNRGESLDDLRQVAALGLVKAVSRFDPGRGTAFESYAVPTIDGEIKRHFRDCMWSVHVPRRVQVLRSRVRAARQELSQAAASDRAPTLPEIAAHARLTEQEVAEGLAALESFSSLSLDAQAQGPTDAVPLSLGETLGAPDPALDTVVDREAVRPQLCRLPEREREILYLRFFGGMTQSAIADALGISQMHVSRLISRSCATIREEIARDPRDPRTQGAATGGARNRGARHSGARRAA